MKPFVTILSLLALTTAAVAQSGGAPPPGEYKGVVRIEHRPQFNTTPASRWIFRAEASVSVAGEVTIGVNVPNAPIPATPYAAPSTLRFHPDEEGNFKFKGTPELAPADDLIINTQTFDGVAVAPDTIRASGLIFRLIDQPFFRGRLQFEGNTFRVTYDNLPLYVSYFIAPPTTTYSYVFRRVQTPAVR